MTDSLLEVQRERGKIFLYISIICHCYIISFDEVRKTCLPWLVSLSLSLKYFIYKYIYIL